MGLTKLVHKVEGVLGVDLDGDGVVGTPQQQPRPQAQAGGYRPAAKQQQHYHQIQPHHYQKPQKSPPPPARPAGGYTGGAAGGGHLPPHVKPPPPPKPDAVTFQDTAPKGNVKALLIGINYKGAGKAELRGCSNDVRTMQKLLRGLRVDKGARGYQEVVLSDDTTFPGGARHPTRKEMLRAFQWLASNNRPGDTLFLHFSGHGSQTRDLDGDEDDGFDETLLPVDFKTAGHITDDVIFDTVCRPLPKGVRLTAVFDCCHSGTAMDLPYVFVADGADMKNALANPAASPMRHSVRRRRRRRQEATTRDGSTDDDDGDRDRGLQLAGGGVQKFCDADVILFSGCADEQTSADVANVQKFGLPAHAGPNSAGGACTHALAKAMCDCQGHLTYVELLERMRQALKAKGYKQIPQLSTSKPVDLSARFSFHGPIGGARVAPVQPPRPAHGAPVAAHGRPGQGGRLTPPPAAGGVRPQGRR